MRAFSIRQLKNNPSTVLRAAEAEAMALVTNRDRAAALVVAIDRLDALDPVAVRTGLALHLFQSGSLSVGAAARMAALPLQEFISLVSSLRIPLTSNEPGDCQADLATARRWLQPQA
jgi:predicted HTH domain antitoxin